MSDLIINGIGRAYLVTQEPKSRPMTNKVFQHSLHRELWQWLADNPEKDKEDWPRWKFNGGDVYHAKDLCFACEYGGCKECPVFYRGNTCSFAEFGQWDRSSGNPQERTRLALIIKDLPVKDGVMTE